MNTTKPEELDIDSIIIRNLEQKNKLNPREGIFGLDEPVEKKEDDDADSTD